MVRGGCAPITAQNGAGPRAWQPVSRLLGPGTAPRWRLAVLLSAAVVTAAFTASVSVPPPPRRHARLDLWRQPRPAATRLQAKKPKVLEPFAFDVCEDDHCETPSIAYKHIKPLLREIARRSHPEESERRATSKVRIYDPYYCQGGSKRRLGKLGFEQVHNENEDFYEVVRGSIDAPGFDVLVTNPPFSSEEHFSSVLDFAIGCGKPWLMILPMHVILEDRFFEAEELAKARYGSGPFYLVPAKKYNFKTPAPLPPPPKENRFARQRSRVTHTFWCVHGGADLEFHGALLDTARRSAAWADTFAATSAREVPREVLPKKFSEEMIRNYERQGLAFPG
mmetsp:Transcript_7639/g.15952  ORF Transcript_7639/g.15952 Transcript_7639/m.15952 type:complete len:337 (-) Transcript_7639:72-1082(-)